MKLKNVSSVWMVVLILTLAGCGSEALPVATLSVQEAGLAPRATPLPTLPPVPRETELTAESFEGAIGAAHGQQLWQEQGCNLCHGSLAAGGSGPRLIGDHLSLWGLLQVARAGRGSMPAYGPDTLSQQDISDIYAWLQLFSAE